MELLPKDYPKYDFIMQGVTHGFHIIDTSTFESCASVEMCNYLSATGPDICHKVEQQIHEELDNGRYIVVTSKPKIVSALGAIPKKRSNDVRLIHDCSRPSGNAVNDYAVNSHFKYQSMQDAVDPIKPGYFLGKIDLAHAYRVVEIHESNYQATGLRWTFQGDQSPTYLVDSRLPFGARRSPEIFNELTQSVRHIMTEMGYPGVIAYLDDFLCVAPSQDECTKTMNELRGVLRALGFHINYNKIEGPNQRLTFLGIVLDSTKMTLELPMDKINDLQSTLQKFYTRTKVTKVQIQALAGKLNWATQCIYGGRFHLRRLIDSYTPLKKP